MRQIARRQDDGFFGGVRAAIEYLMTCERDYLLVVLERHGGHTTNSVDTLCITHKALLEKLRRLGVKTKGESWRHKLRVAYLTPRHRGG